MRILGWDELSEDQRSQVAMLDWSDWGSPALSARLHAPRFRGRPYQEYSSLVAVERGQVLARVGLIRVDLRGPEGSELVLGVSDVITDPRALRRGIASRLVTEAHDRARSEGLSKAFLSTRSSWGAHRGYEKLGYSDVFSSWRAVKFIPRDRSAPRTNRFRLRRGRRSDVPTYQPILETAGRGRWGFIPRSPRSFETRFRLHWSQPKDYLLLREPDAPVGYAMTSTDSGLVTCREAVPLRRSRGGALLDALEHHAAGKWLAFGTTTFLRDHAAEFARRGYLRSDRSHLVIMACPLRGPATAELRRLRALFHSPALFLHQPDTF
jgi:GNAT superfamily N-acetyltransferase